MSQYTIVEFKVAVRLESETSPSSERMDDLLARARDVMRWCVDMLTADAAGVVGERVVVDVAELD